MDFGTKSNPKGEGWWTLWVPKADTFPLLFRKGCFGRCLVSFWHPFDSMLVVFGSHLAPFRLPFGSLSFLLIPFAAPHGIFIHFGIIFFRFSFRRVHDNSAVARTRLCRAQYVYIYIYIYMHFSRRTSSASTAGNNQMLPGRRHRPSGLYNMLLVDFD